MEKDKAVQNQKVFVELRSVLSLQDELRSVQGHAENHPQPGSLDERYWRGCLDGMKNLIANLGLPINT